MNRITAAFVVDAVEPIIRADEAEQHHLCDCAVECLAKRSIVNGVRADLRAQVEALPTTRTKAWDKGWDSVSLNDVLVLLGDEPDAHAPD
jgi:hypothetical protein